MVRNPRAPWQAAIGVRFVGLLALSLACNPPEPEIGADIPDVDGAAVLCPDASGQTACGEDAGQMDGAQSELAEGSCTGANCWDTGTEANDGQPLASDGGQTEIASPDAGPPADAPGPVPPPVAKPCDDGYDCTIDTETADGCTYVHAASGFGCDTGSACGVNKGQCPATWCLPGGKLHCDDANPCTIDTCKGAQGCAHTPALGAVPCEDGNPCTVGDKCGGAVCLPGAPTICADKDPCTVDSCSPTAGCQFTVTPCAAPDACSAPGKLCGGKCVASGKPRFFDKLTDLPSGSFAMIRPTPTGFLTVCDGKAQWYDQAGDLVATQSLPKFLHVGSNADGQVGVATQTSETGPFAPSQFQIWAPTGLLFEHDLGQSVATRAILATPTGWNVTGDVAFSTIGAKAREMRIFGHAGPLLKHVVFANSPDAKELTNWGYPLSDGGWLRHSDPGYEVAQYLRRDSVGKLLWTKFGNLAPYGAVGPAVPGPNGEFVALEMNTSSVQLDANFHGSDRIQRLSKLGTVETGPRVWTPGELVESGALAANDTGYVHVTAMPTDKETSNPDAVMQVVVLRFGGDLKPKWVKGLNLPAFYYMMQNWRAALADNGDVIAFGVSGTTWPYDHHLIRTNSWGHTSCAAAGKCASLTIEQCDDGVECTVDRCDPAVGCVHLPAGYACQDGDPCSQDNCASTGCQHPAAEGIPCTDAEPCTVKETCSGSKCSSAMPPCTDLNPCTLDSCTASGCSHAAAEGLCDDGVPCTEANCLKGVCSATKLACPCQVDADCQLGATCSVALCNQGSCQSPPTGVPVLTSSQLPSSTAPIGFPGAPPVATLPDPALPHAIVPTTGGGALWIDASTATLLRAGGAERWTWTPGKPVLGGLGKADGSALLISSDSTKDSNATVFVMSPQGQLSGPLATLANVSAVTKVLERPMGGWWVLATRKNPDGFSVCRIWKLAANGSAVWDAGTMQSPGGENTCVSVYEQASGDLLVGGNLYYGISQWHNPILTPISAAGKQGYYKLFHHGQLLELADDGKGGLAAVGRDYYKGVWWTRLDLKGDVTEIRYATDVGWVYDAGAAMSLGGGAFVVMAMHKLHFIGGTGVLMRPAAEIPDIASATHGMRIARGAGNTLTIGGLSTPYEYMKVTVHYHLAVADLWGHGTCAGSGACLGVALSDCSDANPCTTDECEPAKGCTHNWVAKDTPCGNGHRCVQGQCIVEIPVL